MTSVEGTSVLICGAGPAGLALAVDLARRDVPFRIVDSRQGPFQGSRGKGIQPRTLEVFEDLGVVDRVLRAGGRYPVQLIHEAHGHREETAIDVHPPTAGEPYGEPWMLPQSNTELLLRERLAELGHAVEWASEVVALTQQDDAVHTELVTSTGNETVQSLYIVGADGGRSAVRKILDIGFPGKTLGVRAIVADLHIEGLDRRYWHRFNDGDMARQLSLCPLQGTDLIQLQAPVSREGDIDASVEGIGRMIAERSGRTDIRVTGAEWVSVYAMNARLADRYRDGRAFLVGDAAHIHPPTGGQGLNTSIQDAYNLGWKLGAVLAGAADDLLDAYEEERRPIAAEMLGLSTRLLDAARRGDMRRGRDAQQLDLGYPWSSIALEAPARTDGLAAGDRAPDACFTTHDGITLRLFQLMQGPHWTALCFDSENAVPSAGPSLVVHHIGPNGDLLDDGTFRDTYAAHKGDWFLIRPDGYIGAILGTGEHHRLEAYLSSVGVRGALAITPLAKGTSHASM